MFLIDSDLEANTVYLDSIKVPLFLLGCWVFPKKQRHWQDVPFLENRSIWKSPPFLVHYFFERMYLIETGTKILPFRDHTEILWDQILAV